MCLSPEKLKDGTQVACRNCDLCKRNRVNDWIGRCLAEQATSTASVSVTLTYSGDGPESALLRYTDIQKFLKRLRLEYSVRYIVAGEYGTKKGRAHWHCVLFFKGKPPPYQLESRFNWEFWPHGHSYFQNPDAGGFAYMLKYIQKGVDDGDVKAFSMSKKPPLGHDFFCFNMAKNMVNQALPLNNPEYSFAGVKDSNGRHRRYWLQGRMREMFLEQYCGLWWLKYRTDAPLSDYLQERWLDPIAKAEMYLLPELFARDVGYKTNAHQEKKELERKAYLRSLRVPLSYLSLGDSQIAIAYSDFTAEFTLKDETPWIVERGEIGLAAQIARLPLPSSLQSELTLWLDATWTGR